MNYLQLVNDFMIETGMDDQIVTVDGQLDDALKASVWVRDAWTEIQRARLWTFRWAEGSFTTVNGQAAYTRAEQNLEAGDGYDLRSLHIPARRVNLRECGYFDLRYSGETGVPSTFALKPNSELLLSLIPDDAYTVAYAYWKAPVILTLDADTPAIDPEWHKAIVWKAIQNYAREQGKEWDGLYQAANIEFGRMYSDMLIKFLPPYLGKVGL